MKTWLATSMTVIGLALAQGCGNSPAGPNLAQPGTGTTGTLPETVIGNGTGDGIGGSAQLDSASVLDGDWIMVPVEAELPPPLACMEFDRGVLVFYDALCFVYSDGSIPNNLDFAAPVSSDGTSVLLSFSYTIIQTWDVVLSGNMLDTETIEAIVATQQREPEAEVLYIPVRLIRQSF